MGLFLLDFLSKNLTQVFALLLHFVLLNEVGLNCRCLWKSLKVDGLVGLVLVDEHNSEGILGSLLDPIELREIGFVLELFDQVVKTLNLF